MREHRKCGWINDSSTERLVGIGNRGGKDFECAVDCVVPHIAENVLRTQDSATSQTVGLIDSDPKSNAIARPR
ncbi:hypothetical protein KCU73_g77, partial [Aureobasidium melanogenum]